MILIIGGATSGKREYARSLGYEDRDISQNLWEILKDYRGNTEDLIESLSRMAAVICNEAGSGVVPIDRQDRDFREKYGRICIELAQRADKVIRIVCGIPTVIK